jgi:hypothetical protein
MSCEHDCDRLPFFPKVIDNRPALPRVGYRIGRYPEMRAHMLDRLVKQPALLGWSHLAADEPGIALLEGAAIVGDVLAFYQELYFNEMLLRTATWRESVAGLVQLFGYRLAPGIGGEALLAVGIDGDRPVTVPAGFPFKAQLDGAAKPAELESVAERLCHPHLGRFRLYRRRLAPQSIASGLSRLEISAVGSATDLASRSAVELSPGDRIMLVPPSQMFDVPGTPLTTQQRAEILVVKDVATSLDRVTITVEGTLRVARGTTVTAYPIGRTFSHFGAAAPVMTTRLEGTPPEVTLEPTNFQRYIAGTDSSSDPLYSTLAREQMPLDQEVDDLAAGGPMICQGVAAVPAKSGPVPFVVVRQIDRIEPAAMAWGNLAGTTSIVTLTARLFANTSILDETADIRTLRFHEAVGPKLTLKAPSAWPSGAFSDAKLNYFGTWEEARAFDGRDLLLEGPDGTLQEVKVESPLSELTATAPLPPDLKMWPIRLTDTPDFLRQDFDEDDPQVWVYGNLIPVTEGKTQAESVIGSGDSRAVFQTFALPKAPLTYLLDETATPAHQPELTVFVDGRLWTPVETFFDRPADAQIYVVREDDEGKSFVQFGDGVNGARLPSGRGNVVATYRLGSGSSGDLAVDAKPKATGKLREVKDVWMPGPVVGGAPPESEADARAAAPGRMQSLGRMVGLADYEAEARAIPGVIKTRAVLDLWDNAPLIRITALTADGSPEALKKVEDTLTTYNRCRGPARHPIKVIQGVRQYVYLHIKAGYLPNRRSEDVAAAIAAALGALSATGGESPESGLFALALRGFGQDLHVSQVIGAVQQTDGVTWAEAVALQPIALGTPPEDDPAQLAKPTVHVLHERIGVTPERVLSLSSLHLDIELEIDAPEEGCAA